MLVRRNAAPVREQAASNIREAIINGYYKPGQRLFEKDLCEQTGVSRTSVREALRQLESEGIVKVIPNRGPSVAKLTMKEAREIYEVRAVLESFAFKLFIERATDEQVNNLVSATDQLEDAYKKGDPATIVELKTEFYTLLMDGCGNKMIFNILKSINARTAFLRKLTLSSKVRQVESIKEIKEIIKYLKKLDGELAEKASLKHVAAAQEFAMKELEKVADS